MNCLLDAFNLKNKNNLSATDSRIIIYNEIK